MNPSPAYFPIVIHSILKANNLRRVLDLDFSGVKWFMLTSSLEALVDNVPY